MEQLRSGLLATLVGIFGLFGAAEAGAQDAAAAPPAPVPAPAVAPVAPPPPPSPLLAPPPAQAPLAAPPAAPARPPESSRGSRSNYDGPPLLLGGRPAIGGYGGVSVSYSNMLNRDGVLLGFEGALLLAHRLSIGFAGYGFARSPQGPAAPDGAPRDFGVGYGGVVVRYAFLTPWPVYPSLGMLIGGGAVVLHREFDDIDDDVHDDHDHDDQGDGFFVVQPELSVHANLTRWMRLGGTVGYRVTSGVSRFGVRESDLNSVVVGGHAQFGWF